MPEDDSKGQESSSESSNSGTQESNGSSPTTPNEDVQAPQSQTFQRSFDSGSTPDENVTAPQSRIVIGKKIIESRAIFGKIIDIEKPKTGD
jgi:hypothetical protein